MRKNHAVKDNLFEGVYEWVYSANPILNMKLLNQPGVL